jgi:hypothetical protein
MSSSIPILMLPESITLVVETGMREIGRKEAREYNQMKFAELLISETSVFTGA